ncbi:hypothetical protein C8Q74DRAFT_750468 [Fomes fomentarius]|nr:hypothetical protein C8Q74DRAFT_750468 [Fomes fomentarius]
MATRVEVRREGRAEDCSYATRKAGARRGMEGEAKGRQEPGKRARSGSGRPDGVLIAGIINYHLLAKKLIGNS